MSSKLANQIRTRLLTFVHNESLFQIKQCPNTKINGQSPIEMINSFDSIEITINNPIETGSASRSGRMKSSYRNLNNIIIHDEEEEIDNSFINDSLYIMKHKTVISDKKMHNSNDISQRFKQCYKKHKESSDSVELISKKNTIKKSYAILRHLSNMLKRSKTTIIKTSHRLKSYSKTKYHECLTQRNQTKSKFKDTMYTQRHSLNSVRQDNNNNNVVMNLQKLPTKYINNNNNKAKPSFMYSSIRSISFNETCETSTMLFDRTTTSKRKSLYKNTNTYSTTNSSTKSKQETFTNKSTFTDYSSVFHSKLFAG